MLRIFKHDHEQLSQHFNSSEFQCPCCQYTIIDTELIILLEKVRSLVTIPLKINSGYRCPRHNAAEGGAPLSRHLMGMAADITWAGAVLNLKENSIFRQQLPSVSVTWNTKLYGIGWGANFVHVDVDVSRKQLTQWVY